MSTDRHPSGLRWLAILAVFVFVTGLVCDLARGHLLWGQAPGGQAESQPASDAQPAAGTQPKDAPSKDAPSAASPAGPSQPGDASGFRSPLIKALDAELARLSKTNPELANSDDDARAILKDADAALARIKAENRAALERLNRRATAGQMVPPRTQRPAGQQRNQNQQAARPAAKPAAQPAKVAQAKDAQSKDAPAKDGEQPAAKDALAKDVQSAVEAVDPRRPADPRDRLPTIVIRDGSFRGYGAHGWYARAPRVADSYYAARYRGTKTLVVEFPRVENE